MAIGCPRSSAAQHVLVIGGRDRSDRTGSTIRLTSRSGTGKRSTGLKIYVRHHRTSTATPLGFPFVASDIVDLVLIASAHCKCRGRIFLIGSQEITGLLRTHIGVELTILNPEVTSLVRTGLNEDKVRACQCGQTVGIRYPAGRNRTRRQLRWGHLHIGPLATVKRWCRCGSVSGAGSLPAIVLDEILVSNS